ncbi:XRE family transcriptional regulator [Deinococcus cavernae]|uniref:XRE family transcriptional regulator n=1 Tax=Deinococcus cavernae TaxID=2320857 RepID=A0A418VFW1_9DEIO|nr:helix-turn-helix transcriptional regulator [Deinococcus cavernae]RJF74977.1 XRE family transcriptional regulator [Deinococcus cavernae]
MVTVNGAVLRELRQANGLTLVELAKRTKIDRRTLSGYEKKTIADPRCTPIHRLARHYNVTMEHLLKDEES